MPTQLRFIAVACLSISNLVITAAAQQAYNSQLHRFQTEIVATGLKQPSAMIFLPDGTALLVERQKGIDRFDPRSNKLTPLEAPKPSSVPTREFTTPTAQPRSQEKTPDSTTSFSIPTTRKMAGSISLTPTVRASAAPP